MSERDDTLELIEDLRNANPGVTWTTKGGLMDRAATRLEELQALADLANGEET